MQTVSDLAVIAQEFVARAHAAVWCSAATVDSRGRPRSRVLHPLWEGTTGWIGVNRHSPKAGHIANTPFISLAYIKDPLKPVYAECHAMWEDTLEEKQRVWELFTTMPEPLGYNLGLIWHSAHDEQYGLLRLRPWRIVLYDLFDQQHTRAWHEQEP
jgi:hypothetical protein